MPSSSLQNKVALVTGGNRGIGRAICESLAAAGSHIVIHASSERAEWQQLANDLAARHGIRAVFLAADLRYPSKIDALFEQFDSHFDHLDILVNNAGVENYHAAEEMPLDAWQHILQVNLSAPFQCSQHAARRMKSRGNGGVIINVSSIHDTVARKGISHYCCAKAGLRMLTRVTALEWAEYGIRVVTVSPGAIETDMNRDAIDGIGRDHFHEWIPAGRIGETSEIGQTITFLCGDAASYITGTELYVDGGYSINLVRYDDRPGRSELRSV